MQASESISANSSGCGYRYGGKNIPDASSDAILVATLNSSVVNRMAVCLERRKPSNLCLMFIKS